MIGDRTGAIHVGKGTVMDLERQKIDLPFSVHVYDGGYLGLAPDTFIHGVDIFLNGTLANVENLTLHHEGKLWMNIDGRTKGLDASTYEFQFVHVKNTGYIHMISDPVKEPSISFTTIALNIDGGGLVRGTYVVYNSLNITIDAGGVLSADGLGYELADGETTDSNGNVRKGLHGVINPGLGYTSSHGASGAGHGGSGGRGHCKSKFKNKDLIEQYYCLWINFQLSISRQFLLVIQVSTKGILVFMHNHLLTIFCHLLSVMHVFFLYFNTYI